MRRLGIAVLVVVGFVAVVPLLVVGVVMFSLAPWWIDATAVGVLAVVLGWIFTRGFRRGRERVPGHESLSLKPSKEGLL